MLLSQIPISSNTGETPCDAAVKVEAADVEATFVGDFDDELFNDESIEIIPNDEPFEPKYEKVPKKRRPSEKRTHELLTVSPACETCNPATWRDGSVEFFKTGTQSDLDIAYSKHMIDIHGETTMYRHECDYYSVVRIKFNTKN